MSKYVVETFYTCTFKIVHKLDELSEKKLSELANRNDGQVQIIDVRLNNRKTKKANKKDNTEDSQNKLLAKDISEISSAINEKITTSGKLKVSNESLNKNTEIQKFNKKNTDNIIEENKNQSNDRIYINIKALDKITAKTSTFRLAIGEKKLFGALAVHLLKSDFQVIG